MPVRKQIVNETETSSGENLTLNLPAPLHRRIKDRAIMAGETPERIASDLLEGALGSRPPKPPNNPTRSEQQLILLRWAIQTKINRAKK